MAGDAEADPFDFCINLWSTPRSLSTSLMYAFAQRGDTEVVDEPLYAHYLRVSGAKHPLREEVLAAQNSNGADVVAAVVYTPQRGGKLRFIKHMAKHCTPDIRSSLLSRGRHVVLFRDPLLLLSSFGKVAPPSLDETGLPEAVAICSALGSSPRAAHGRDASAPARVVVLDSADVARNPEGALKALCGSLGIPFMASMLRWEPGPRPEDGVWAPAWYQQVHKSSGLGPKPYPYSSLIGAKERAPFVEDPALYALLEDCHPFFSTLRARALRVPPSPSSPPPPDPPLPVETNRRLLVWVGEGLIPRHAAKVSVLDSIVQGGDGTWEGLRIYNGRVFKLDEHLNRLMDSAKALAFEGVPTRDQIRDALTATLAANGMRSNAHVRLTLTRGLKVTSGMSPHFNQHGCTLIVLAEWKPPVYDNAKGIALVTASNRRNPPQCLDSKIHHNNLLNNILAKIEGNNAGMDDAVMLDIHGYVSETNATNIFIVKDGTLRTPATSHHCLPGITRQTVVDLGRALGIPTEETSITVSDLHSADEVFTTGTMGELTPCISIDKRSVGGGSVGPVTRRLQKSYQELTASQGWSLPPFPEAAF